ncbi:HlyC/CorC family transporter [bacterium]|jgi:putative hemolysin|nr:HlyC/CorC family transporter [bacterium]MBT4649202.1 HlyC/CorC family transporter [bacterium]
MTLIILVILILLSGWFSGMEIALFSLSSAKLRSLVLANKTNSQILQKLLNNKRRLLAIILLGNNLVNIGAASLATMWAIERFGSAGVGIATGVMTVLILVFGEMYPKAWFQINAAKMSLLFAPLVYSLQILFFPIVFLMEKVLYVLTKGAQPEIVSEKEFKALSRLAVEEGVIDFEEHEMIMNVLSFNDKIVKEVMTSFYKAAVLNKDAAIDQVAYFMAQEGLSRYPVYSNNKDNIIGYVHVIDVMKILNSDKREEPLENFIQAILEVTEDTKIDKLFAKMRQKKSHMAIVKRKNEDQVIGLITMEDLLEELVGEIEDEND